MTTILYKDGVMLGDTQVTSGNSASLSTRKIFRNDKGDLLGMCGNAMALGPLRDWFMAGETGEYEIGEDIEVLIVRADGTVTLHCDGGWFEPYGEYFAVGSGSDYALGALAAGATPEQAMQAAMKHDTGTGGQIDRLVHIEG